VREKSTAASKQPFCATENGVDDLFVVEQADQRRHAVVAQSPAWMEGRRMKVCAQGVHLDDGRHLGLVAA
jgi:hypothetical protein